MTEPVPARPRDMDADGLSPAGELVVVAAVIGVLLLGAVTFVQRERAIAEEGVALRSAAATSATREPTTYVVQEGDTILSVAAALGIGPSHLVYWNRDLYPTLETTPALRPGWVLRTTGTLPPAEPIPTQAAVGQAAATPAPDDSGVPVFGPEAFRASGSVTVSYYAVSGFTASEIAHSMQRNGPFSEWLQRRVQAQVSVTPTYNFDFHGRTEGECTVELIGPSPVTLAYQVLLPSWSPPPNVASWTIDWWTQTITETVAHEAQHIELYEAKLSAMNAVVVTGTCASAAAELDRLWAEVTRENCAFDVAEYGVAMGRTVASCVGQ